MGVEVAGTVGVDVGVEITGTVGVDVAETTVLVNGKVGVAVAGAGTATVGTFEAL